MGTADSLDQVAINLRQRFPLLGTLFVRSAISDSEPEPLPPYLGLFLSVMLSPPEPPICFVLPKRGNISRLATVLYSIICFAKKCPQLIREYGDTNFTIGESVRVLPSGHVYQYGGFNPQYPGFIWLNLLDKSGKRVLDAAYVTRLEKTTLKRPIGRMDTDFRQPETQLDRLLGIRTYGNRSLFRNEVVILDSKSGFEEFSDSVILEAGKDISSPVALSKMFPFGQLSEPDSSNRSWIRKLDERIPFGEPLVAVTHSDEFLEGHCMDAKTHSQLIVVNGLSRIRNVQVYDNIYPIQRMVLFADHDDEEMIRTLGKRGCRFWMVTNQEMKIGVDPSNLTKKGLIGDVARWSDNHGKLTLRPEPCECQALDIVRLELEKLRNEITINDDGPLTKLVRRAWRILNDESAVIGRLDQADINRFKEQVSLLRKETQDSRTWVSTANKKILDDVADGLELALDPAAKLGSSKKQVLDETISKMLEADTGFALVARNENQVGSIVSVLNSMGLQGKAPVYSPSTLPDDGAFDKLVCTSWLGGDLMKQLVSSLVSPEISVLAYPFEKIWLSQLQNRLNRPQQVAFITPDEKIKIVIGDPQAGVEWPTEMKEGPVPPTTDADIWVFEQKLRSARKGLATTPTEDPDTVPAYYVSFVGEAYAFLTPTHKVVVATEIVSRSRRQSHVLPERLVTDIKQGDFIVFPASGGRELTHETADQLLGSEAVELRERAHRWKDAIIQSGLTPAEFLAKAKDLGRPRHISTIRNWFEYESQIGPGEQQDLVLIALVTNSRKLESEMDLVWDAIKRLWSAHLSAGSYLRDVLLNELPKVIRKVEENGTEVDLGNLGSAWVVQVESIDRNIESRGSGEVNRLLWE